MNRNDKHEIKTNTIGVLPQIKVAPINVSKCLYIYIYICKYIKVIILFYFILIKHTKKSKNTNKINLKLKKTIFF